MEIEPTLIAGLLIAIGLAAAVTIWPLLRPRKSQFHDVMSLSGAVQTLKMCLQNPAAWDAMIRDPLNPPGLRCVLERDGCADVRPVAINHVLAAPNKFCLPGYDLSNPAQGLTADGTRCDGFRESGNAACPYRIEVSWVPHCPSGAKSCSNPVEDLIFALAYRPGSKSEAPPFGDDVARPSFGDRQTFEIARGREAGGDTVVVAEAMPSGVAAGPCRAGTKPTQRNMNLVVTDAAGRVATDQDGTFWMRRGTYDCRLSTPGFKVGAFRSFVVDLESKRYLLTSSTEYSSSLLIAAQTRAVGSTRLELRASVNHLAIFQFCGEEAGGPPEVKNMALGVPAGLGPEIYATLDCAIVPEEVL